MRVTAFAGGVGGAKLADGLYRILQPNELNIVVNTGDDFELYGLRISPDADTVLYTLAGLANPDTGWGVAGDTFETMAMLERYGEERWFQLGDRDFATHIWRTQRLKEGWTPTKVAHGLAEALGLHAMLLPMSDEPVATQVRTSAGDLAFQDYFVRRHHSDAVQGVTFAGIERAQISAEARAAIEAADVVLFCPSNPVVSIGPILALPGMRDLLKRVHVPIVAVSPIVGGKALRGPADQMLAGLGHESSAFGVANLYRDLIDGLVIDHEDAEEQGRIQALGLRTLITNTVMRTVDDRAKLAAEVLDFGAELAR